MDHKHLVLLFQVYHVKGRFGLATHNCSPAGKIIERTTYRKTIYIAWTSFHCRHSLVAC